MQFEQTFFTVFFLCEDSLSSDSEQKTDGNDLSILKSKSVSTILPIIYSLFLRIFVHTRRRKPVIIPVAFSIASGHVSCIHKDDQLTATRGDCLVYFLFQRSFGKSVYLWQVSEYKLTEFLSCCCLLVNPRRALFLLYSEIFTFWWLVFELP